jgi:hypothetical protein
MSEYVPIPYPACRYHPTRPAIVVASEAEDAALGPGWVDHPSKFPKAKPSNPEPTPEPEPKPEPKGPPVVPVSPESLFGSPAPEPADEADKPAPRPRKSK